MNRLIVLGVIVLALVAAAGSLLFVVDQRQTAVVFALGEIKRVIKEPGLYFKLPPPFQNVQYFDNRTLTLDSADIDRFITAEKLNIQVDSYVKWRIVATAVSLYYYLGIVRALYMRSPLATRRAAVAGGAPPRETVLQASVLACLAITVGSFFAVQPLIDVARDAAAALPF